MSGIQACHLAFDLVVALGCMLAVYQWRWWMREAGAWKRLAEEAERTNVGALAVARYCHDRMQRAVTEAEAMVATTTTEQVRELQ